MNSQAPMLLGTQATLRDSPRCVAPVLYLILGTLMHDIGSMLTAWESFYVIIGSSSAGLTGLMFVVITLTPESRTQASDDTISAFATPNVVHFCAALLVSAVLSAPWNGLFQPALLIDLVGLACLVYVCIVVQRARRQTAYRPVFEDWLWHMLLPMVAYVTITAAGIELPGRPTGALFGIAAATTLLLFIGIHNAWDTVTFLALERMRTRDDAKPTLREQASDEKQAGEEPPDTRR